MNDQNTEWVCPNCGTNDDISEISLAWVIYRGAFNETARIDMFDTETPMIDDNPDDPCTYYVCNGCDFRFDDPMTKEEYEESVKE